MIKQDGERMVALGNRVAMAAMSAIAMHFQIGCPACHKRADVYINKPALRAGDAEHYFNCPHCGRYCTMRQLPE